MILSEKDSIQCWCLKSSIKFTQENSQRLKQNPQKCPFHTQLLGKKTENHCHTKPNSDVQLGSLDLTLLDSLVCPLTYSSPSLEQTHPWSRGKEEDAEGIKSLQNQSLSWEKGCVFIFHNPQSIQEKRFFFIFLLMNSHSQKSCYQALTEVVSLCAKRHKKSKDLLSLKLATPFQL